MLSFQLVSDYVLYKLKTNLLLISVNPLAAEIIYLLTSAECAGSFNRATAVKGFMEKMMISQYFCICIYIW